MRRGADILILLAAVSLLVLGTAFTLTDPALTGASSSYDDAVRCAEPGQAFLSKCYDELPATVVGARINVDRGAVPHPTVTVRTGGPRPAQLSLEIPHPPGAFHHLRAGETVALKVYDGLPTAVTADHQVMATTYDPGLPDPLRREGGISLMGVSLLILLIRPPSRAGGVLSLVARPGALRQGAIEAVLRTRQLAQPFVTFAALQLLDIATTLRGARVGLFEGNPLAGELASRIGPVTGYFVVKAAALIVLFLTMARLPQRLAALVGWCACVIMAVVVLHNAVLIST